MTARSASFSAVSGKAWIKGWAMSGNRSDEKNTPESSHIGSITRFIKPETASVVFARLATNKPRPAKLAAPGFSLQVTLIPDKEGRFEGEAALKGAVEKSLGRFVEGSVEGKLELVRLEAKAGPAFYATFTDAKLAEVASPPEGQFKKVSSGMLGLHRVVAVFTVLYNDGAADAARRALEGVAGLRAAP